MTEASLARLPTHRARPCAPLSTEATVSGGSVRRDVDDGPRPPRLVEPLDVRRLLLDACDALGRPLRGLVDVVAQQRNDRRLSHAPTASATPSPHLTNQGAH